MEKQLSYYAAPGMKGDSLKEAYRPLMPVDIMNIVCSAYEVKQSDLKARTRERPTVFPRHLAMYLIYKFTNLGLSQIGRLFNRDHTTVIHAKRMIENYIETDSLSKRREIQEIINRCEYRVL